MVNLDIVIYCRKCTSEKCNEVCTVQSVITVIKGYMLMNSNNVKSRFVGIRLESKVQTILYSTSCSIECM